VGFEKSRPHHNGACILAQSRFAVELLRYAAPSLLASKPRCGDRQQNPPWKQRMAHERPAATLLRVVKPHLVSSVCSSINTS